ncbi:MAG: hypothetical protein R2911_41005 [Caldilineaceae bacterium]
MQTINTNITTGLVVIVLALLGYLLVLSLRRRCWPSWAAQHSAPPGPIDADCAGADENTIIIVSALSTGDTLGGSSLRRQTVSAYGQIDEIITPPLLSMLITLGDVTESPVVVDTATRETTTAPCASAPSTQNRDQINELMKVALAMS